MEKFRRSLGQTKSFHIQTIWIGVNVTGFALGFLAFHKITGHFVLLMLPFVSEELFSLILGFVLLTMILIIAQWLFFYLKARVPIIQTMTGSIVFFFWLALAYIISASPFGIFASLVMQNLVNLTLLPILLSATLLILPFLFLAIYQEQVNYPQIQFPVHWRLMNAVGGFSIVITYFFGFYLYGELAEIVTATIAATGIGAFSGLVFGLVTSWEAAKIENVFE